MKDLMTRMFTLNSRGRKLIYKKNLKLSRYVCIFFVLNFAWNYCVYLFLYKRFKLNIIFSRQLWLGRTCRRVFLKVYRQLRAVILAHVNRAR